MTWTFKNRTSGAMSGSGSTWTFAWTSMVAGSFCPWMIQWPDTVSITGATTTDGAMDSIGSIFQPGSGVYTADYFLFGYTFPTVATSQTVTATFSGTPGTAPNFIITEFVPVLGGIVEIDSAASLWDSYNATAGTAITMFTPNCQYPNGELFVFLAKCSASPSSVGGGYTETHDTSQHMSCMYNLNAGAPLSAPVYNFGSNSSVCGLGVMFYIQNPYIPTVIAELGVM
jgi:hypothetical protein